MSYPISNPKLSLDFRPEVALRATGLVLLLGFSFLIAAPIQWAILRFVAPNSNVLPRLFYSLVLWLSKIRVKVHGLRQDEVPQLIAANHVSWTDIPALGTLRFTSFVAKIEVATWPIVGTFARLQRSIFIDRGKPKSIQAANRTMADLIRSGLCVALFPEGTTYDGTELGGLRSAHFAVAPDILNSSGARLRIHPVAIRYSAPHAAWIGDALLLPHVIGLFSGPAITCDLIFCPPIELDAGLDRKAIALECRRRIAAALASEG